MAFGNVTFPRSTRTSRDGGAWAVGAPKMATRCCTLADLQNRSLSRHLQSKTHDRAAYAACQTVAAAAHQVGYHGIVAPAATKMGDTLVLFTELLPHGEHPVRTKQETWFELAADPRKPGRGGHLRVVR